jgi:hypothetical protein
MDNNNVSIHSSHESKFGPEELDRRVILEPIVQRVINALLMLGIMQALFGIVLPSISKFAKETKERDGQIVDLALHLIQILIFIKDILANTHLSMDQADSECSSLQTRIVKAPSETHKARLNSDHYCQCVQWFFFQHRLLLYSRYSTSYFAT